MTATRQAFKLPSRLDRAVTEVDSLLASCTSELDLDFQEVTFIGVEGLEWLEELLLRAQSASRSVHFINVQPEQYKVFKVAHIRSLLEACSGTAVSGPAC